MSWAGGAAAFADAAAVAVAAVSDSDTAADTARGADAVVEAEAACALRSPWAMVGWWDCLPARTVCDGVGMGVRLELAGVASQTDCHAREE